MKKNIHWEKFPLFIKWYITSKCNLRCTHCYLSDYTIQPDSKRVNEIVDYLISKKIYGVIFLGGEPLLKEDFCDIASKLSKNGIFCSVSTNGTTVTQEYAAKLKKSGIKSCQVSLESHEAIMNDSIRGNGVFHKAVKGAKYLIESGINTTIGFTLNKKNYHQIPEMINLSKNLKANSVRFEIFIPVGTGDKNAVDLLLTKNEINEVKNSLNYQTKINNNIIIEHPYRNQNDSCSGCSTTGCGAGTTNLIINSDFTVSACDILNESDRTKIKINNVEDIEKFWLKEKIFKKWRGEEEHSKFGDFSDVHQSPCHVANLRYGFKVV